MSREPDSSGRERLLGPVDRISEVLFGLIMVLTFTCTLSAVSANDAQIRELIMAAIGCNAAWGLVDGVMFLTMGQIDRAHDARTLRTIRAATPDMARTTIAEALPPSLATAFDERDLGWLQARVAELPEPPEPKLTKNDGLAACGVALLVFGSTFPVAIPFIVIDDAMTALRTSNLVALVMLFVCGTALGRYAGGRPYRTGLTMTAVGVVLVAVTIALGG